MSESVVVRFRTAESCFRINVKSDTLWNEVFALIGLLREPAYFAHDALGSQKLYCHGGDSEIIKHNQLRHGDMIHVFSVWGFC
jgi:hypothetical protein